MRQAKRALLVLGVVGALGAGQAESRKPLADIYKSGKVRFVQERALDEKTMPEGVLFAGPSDLTVDSDGRVLVMDFADNNIKIFDPSGNFLKVVGRKGQGPGEFNMPIDIVFARDRVVVWDMGNRRLCAFTPAGDFIKSENASIFSARPHSLGALPTGEIVLETEKTYFGEAGRPQDCSIDILTPDLQSKKTIYSKAVLRDKYIRLKDGTTNLPQPYSPDVHWDVAPSGRIVIGFSEKYEIGVYDSAGVEESRFSHSYDPVKVTAEDVKEFFDGMTQTTETGIRRGAPDHIVKNTTFPKFKPAFNAVIVDSDGNILVHTYPKNKDDMLRYFDAFDGRGKFLGRVRVEGDVLFPAWHRRSPIVDGCFWAVEYSNEESPRVVKYRISE
jgi:hypothetical protein